VGHTAATSSQRIGHHGGYTCDWGCVIFPADEGLGLGTSKSIYVMVMVFSFITDLRLQLFSTFLCAIISTLPLACLTFLPPTPPNVASVSKVLNALNLCLASTVISITTVLNFSLAATLAVTLGFPLSLASPHQQLYARLGKYGAYIGLAFGWMMLSEETRMAMWDWEVLGVWFAPFVCIVYSPLVLQAGIASLLPP
jgi:glycosylphosphatidylinositol transamidase